MEYKILSSLSIKELQDVVQEHLNVGWVPLGGVCATGWFFQAMTYQDPSYRGPL